ncbi:MAG TPA: response regulator [Streptosporangiaceae bacterium]
MNSTVLYIEDNADNVRLVELLLKRRPHTELQVATNGRDGVQAAIGQRPTLILLDNHLPDATGSEILRQLASAEGTAGIPVIILTGDSGRVAADELLAIGACEFLEKPFDIHQLMATIDRYLP